MKTSSLNLNLKLNYIILYRSRIVRVFRGGNKQQKTASFPHCWKYIFNPLMMPYDEDILLFNLKEKTKHW